MPTFAAPEHHGLVTFNGLPVPGATVTATRGNRHLVAISDPQGVYSFTELDEGTWKFQVEMLGFATQTQEIHVASDSPSPVWELKLLPLAEITHGLPVTSLESTPPPSPPASVGAGVKTAPGTPPAKSPGFQRATVNSATNTPPPPAVSETGASASESSNDLTQRAATGLLVNGSVNNGAASAFSQAAAFGNNRKGPGSLYNGGLGVIFDTSAWDAAPFSLTSIAAPKPTYSDVQIVSALGGPLGIPHHLVSNSNFFVAYQHQANDNSTTLPGRVPTLIERSGNLSQTLNAAGKPVQIFNPSTGALFPGNVIPVSPQAQALLNEYPLPNVSTSSTYNYQATTLSTTQQNSVQSRVSKNKGRNQFFGNFAYQGTADQSTSLFGFHDSTNSSGLDSAVNWQRIFRPGGNTFFTTNFKYEFSRLTTNVTPYFAGRNNVSGEAGILGNDQQPSDWGPPALIFSSGLAGLSEPEYARNANQTQAFSYSSLWYRSRHILQFGADLRRQQVNIHSQQDARGTFAFTGAATQGTLAGVPAAGTGSDLADFLLGIPDTGSIDFGNADKYLRGWGYDAFIDDDWRVQAGLTLHAGLRWEYAEPFAELYNRLANLDLAPGFSAAASVVAGDPTGALTGHTYPHSLLWPDHRGIEPRLGIAWRPKANSPLVIRAGYGIYDNTSVYQVIATQLAQQPPFTKALSIQNSRAEPLALATAFSTVSSALPNTFAVDPNFRIGYVQNWNVSVQQDLPASLTMIASYLGTKGTRLMQEFLPNTYPLGAMDPCLDCPADFVYLGSSANSTREAGQIQLRRRLRDGLTATLQYTYSKAIDDASAFSGAGLIPTGSTSGPGAPSTGSSSASSSTASNSVAPSIAQNWLDLGAERGPSTFDQRHLLNLQLQYTSGEGLRGGALLGGWKGLLFKEWTVTAQLTAGTGLPLTPVYLTNVTGTAITGTIRPDDTGAPVKAAPPGFFLNPAAYTAPARGQWGDAGRDSITGPEQFSLNGSIGRTFRLGNRLNADWRMNATNLLNTVTYTSWNTTVTSPLFGLPSSANTMRKLQTTFRLRF